MERCEDTARELHSTRLFPKNQGAERYVPTGIAGRCDWVVLSDRQAPQTSLLQLKPGPPQTVFLSLREPFAALEFFYTEVLPKIHGRFVLVSGSEDVTLPAQLDKRWRSFNARERELLERIRLDSRVVAWFAENLDTAAAKMHALPTGVLPDGPALPQLYPAERPPAHAARPTRVLCCHRVREGAQWQTRKNVSAYCRSDGADLCTVIEEEVSLEAYIQAQQQHAFVLCVEGGGLDPSPKAWTSMRHGAIPIIRRTAASQAYADLPVAFVDDWSTPFLNRDWLESERTRLAHCFDQPEGWKKLCNRLSLDFWWRRISCFLQTRAPAPERVPGRLTPLFVIGMHRSGTSLLTALLARCGAHPGRAEDLTGPNQHNPKGFWENNQFREINDQLLQSQACEWDSPLDFAPSKIDPALAATLEQQARKLFEQFPSDICPLVKDPRLCLTLAFWKPRFAALAPVLIVRHPIEVARSLFKRNRIPVPMGIALWELYNLRAARELAGLQPVLCQHADLVYKPVEALARLIGVLNARHGLGLCMPERAEIERFVETDLHRETAASDELAQLLVADQQAVWHLLKTGKLSELADRELSAASRAALEGYRALGMQFSTVRHLQRLQPAPVPGKSSA